MRNYKINNTLIINTLCFICFPFETRFGIETKFLFFETLFMSSGKAIHYFYIDFRSQTDLKSN
jgi:hypothetical protein